MINDSLDLLIFCFLKYFHLNLIHIDQNKNYEIKVKYFYLILSTDSIFDWSYLNLIIQYNLLHNLLCVLLYKILFYLIDKNKY